MTPAPASLVLSGATCLLYQTPLLYVWRRGQDVLYVGMSRGGVSRPLSRSHDRIKAIAPADTLELLLRPYACTMGLLSEEARLIARLKPLRNGFDPLHVTAVKAHPGDCPLSGEHVQLEREAAVSAQAARRERQERERAESEAARLRQLARPQPAADGTWTPEDVAYYLAVKPAQVEKWISTGLLPTEHGRVTDSTLRAIIRHGLPLPAEAA
jgi:hypothetical protein